MGLEIQAYILSALTTIGGIVGYVKTKSKPSIIAGSTVGLLYGIGGYRIQNGESFGLELGLLASALLGGASIPRAIKLRKPVPIFLSILAAFGALTFRQAGKGMI